jgi:hypothetical protein
MPGKNKTPLLGWHPPAELSARVRSLAQRRSVPISVILNEAVTAYLALLPPWWWDDKPVPDAEDVN